MNDRTGDLIEPENEQDRGGRLRPSRPSDPTQDGQRAVEPPAGLEPVGIEEPLAREVANRPVLEQAALQNPHGADESRHPGPGLAEH